MRIELNQAVKLLAQGQLVAIPTETVYGLAADATNLDAVTKVFQRKGRPVDHPVIVHLAQASWAAQWAVLPPCFETLAAHFWPGPLTLVVPKLEHVPSCITGGQATVALRIPQHPLSLRLLERLGRALVAPSANRFGHTSPTNAEHVEQEFGPEFPVLDGGPCSIGLESTILDLSGPQPRILRPGHFTRAQLEPHLGPLSEKKQEVPRVPGALAQHYAPRTPTYLIGQTQSVPSEYAWMGFASRNPGREVIMPTRAPLYAQTLYAALRQLDSLGCAKILVESPPQTPEWEAVWDRLRRACRS